MKESFSGRKSWLLLFAPIALTTMIASCGGNSGGDGSPPPAEDDDSDKSGDVATNPACDPGLLFNKAHNTCAYVCDVGKGTLTERRETDDGIEETKSQIPERTLTMDGSRCPSIRLDGLKNFDAVTLVNISVVSLDNDALAEWPGTFSLSGTKERPTKIGGSLVGMKEASSQNQSSNNAIAVPPASAIEHAIVDGRISLTLAEGRAASLKHIRINAQRSDIIEHEIVPALQLAYHGEPSTVIIEDIAIANAFFGAHLAYPVSLKELTLIEQPKGSIPRVELHYQPIVGTEVVIDGAHLPLVAERPLDVGLGGTLRIMPGTTIKLNNSQRSLTLEGGSLIAEGTPTHPIKFEMHDNIDGRAHERGVRIGEKTRLRSVVSLKHAVFTGGGLLVFNADLKLTDSSISDDVCYFKSAMDCVLTPLSMNDGTHAQISGTLDLDADRFSVMHISPKKTADRQTSLIVDGQISYQGGSPTMDDVRDDCSGACPISGL